MSHDNTMLVMQQVPNIPLCVRADRTSKQIASGTKYMSMESDISQKVMGRRVRKRVYNERVKRMQKDARHRRQVRPIQLAYNTT